MEATATRICIPAQTCCLAQIRSFCQKILESHLTDRQLHRKMILAIDEAVANIIEHAYATGGDSARSTVEVSIEVRPDRIVARILDRGRPFDPRGTDAPGRENGERAGPAAGGVPPGEVWSVRQFPQRGFGLQLIRLIVDQIDYQRTSDGENVLVLTKRLKKGLEP